MNKYNIPDKYFFRIHHIRPRFKGDIENVLIYMAEEISAIGEKPTNEFISSINNAIYHYPGNANRKVKTINNWRTEISALFGFIEHTTTTYKPGRRAIELAEHQDLVECFKIFLYNFQYPGAHIKPKNVLEQIEVGIHFKPAQYILKLLRYANKNGGNSIGITKFEVCHCIFNDLRVTRDNDSVEKTWERILLNRNKNYEYDQTSDIIRYAGDIIDYMEIANLIKTYDNKMYYLNILEEESIIKFCESSEWFSEYDTMIEKRIGSMEEVKACIPGWFSYVNRDIHSTDFATDILSYIVSDLNKSEQQDTTISNLVDRNNELQHRIISYYDTLTTKDIGDIGEYLVHSHECMRLKMGGREDLIHLIKRIPTQLALGYDISSVELDEKKRCIEVKTTISSKPLDFNRIRLTKNEWNAASSIHDRYYVYRLLLSKSEKKLFLLQDPVGLYKKNLIDMVPSDGAYITFDPNSVGRFEELLTWEN